VLKVPKSHNDSVMQQGGLAKVKRLRSRREASEELITKEAIVLRQWLEKRVEAR